MVGTSVAEAVAQWLTSAGLVIGGAFAYYKYLRTPKRKAAIEAEIQATITQNVGCRSMLIKVAFTNNSWHLFRRNDLELALVSRDDLPGVPIVHVAGNFGLADREDASTLTVIATEPSGIRVLRIVDRNAGAVEDPFGFWPVMESEPWIAYGATVRDEIFVRLPNQTPEELGWKLELQVRYARPRLFGSSTVFGNMTVRYLPSRATDMGASPTSSTVEP